MMASAIRKAFSTDAVGHSQLKLHVVEKRDPAPLSPLHAGPSRREEAVLWGGLSLEAGMTERTSVALTLSGLLAPGWELVRPLEIALEVDEDGSLIVSDEVFLQYGVGRTIREALRDYASNLIELYRLTQTDAETDPNVNASFRYLQAYLKPLAK